MDVWVLAFHNTFFEDDYIVGVCETKEKAKELLAAQSVTPDWSPYGEDNECGYQQGTDRLWRVVKHTLNNLDVSVIRRGIPV